MAHLTFNHLLVCLKSNLIVVHFHFYRRSPLDPSSALRTGSGPFRAMLKEACQRLFVMVSGHVCKCARGGGDDSDMIIS